MGYPRRGRPARLAWGFLVSMGVLRHRPFLRVATPATGTLRRLWGRGVSRISRTPTRARGASRNPRNSDTHTREGAGAWRPGFGGFRALVYGFCVYGFRPRSRGDSGARRGRDGAAAGERGRRFVGVLRVGANPLPLALFGVPLPASPLFGSRPLRPPFLFGSVPTGPLPGVEVVVSGLRRRYG